VRLRSQSALATALAFAGASTSTLASKSFDTLEPPTMSYVRTNFVGGFNYASQL
jgi:hypothetical protein